MALTSVHYISASSRTTASRDTVTTATWLLSIAIGALLVGRLFHAATSDELYHVLAARGYLATGSFAIGDGGVYLRGWPISWSVAQLFRITGEHLAVARLVALLPLLGVLVLGGRWLSRQLNPETALIWLALVGSSPIMLDVGTSVRWYSFTALLGFLCFWGIIQAVPPDKSPVPRLAWAAVALLAVLGIATFMPEMAGPILILAAALSCWMVVTTWPLRIVAIVLPAAALAAALAGGVLFQRGVLQELWASYRNCMPWAAATADAKLYYHSILLADYPSLWPMTGLLWLAGRRLAPRLVDGAALVAGLGLLLHSGAAMKAGRYVAYLLPWLMLIWAAGLQVCIRWVLDHGGPAWQRPSALRTLLACLAVAFALLANMAPVRAIAQSFGLPIAGQTAAVDWDRAAPRLHAELTDARTLITTDPNDLLYRFDRVGYAIHGSLYGEITDRPTPVPQGDAAAVPVGAELLRDPRTGTIAVRDEAVLARLLACVPDAIVVSSTYRWHNRFITAPAMRAFVERTLVPVDLPQDSLILAWRWDNPLPLAPCPGS